MSNLFDFAFCGTDYDRKIDDLTSMAPEKWSFGVNSDNIILKNYISHTFMKANSEGKIMIKDKYSIFNTGLYDLKYAEICAYFTPNHIPDKQTWFFEGFYTAYKLLTKTGVENIPPRVNYFEDPSALVFDTNYDIVPQYDHIFEDSTNYSRIPKSIRENENVGILFEGALKRSKCMINANYKTAVPQYYDGKIQLLIPICLINEERPDVALVVSKSNKGKHYLGHTCLTLDMAYNNARLIARPDSLWLKP